MLADMAAGIEAGRLLTYKAAFEIDNVSSGIGGGGVVIPRRGAALVAR